MALMVLPQDHHELTDMISQTVLGSSCCLIVVRQGLIVLKHPGNSNVITAISRWGLSITGINHENDAKDFLMINTSGFYLLSVNNLTRICIFLRQPYFVIIYVNKSL